MEKLYSWEQVAEHIGISVEELKAFAIKEGLIDENGLPSKWALDEGLLKAELEEVPPQSAEEKRKAIIFAELNNYRNNLSVSETYVLNEIQVWQKMSESEIASWYEKIFIDGI